MKKLLFVFSILFCISCAGPDRKEWRRIPLGEQTFTIVDVHVCKYSFVELKYDLPLSNKQSMTLYAGNSASGYYYKKYKLKKGYILKANLFLLQKGEEIVLEDIDLSSYEE